VYIVFFSLQISTILLLEILSYDDDTQIGAFISYNN